MFLLTLLAIAVSTGIFGLFLRSIGSSHVLLSRTALGLSTAGLLLTLIARRQSVRSHSERQSV
jgi:hypothetical protein